MTPLEFSWKVLVPLIGSAFFFINTIQHGILNAHAGSYSIFNPFDLIRDLLNFFLAVVAIPILSLLKILDHYGVALPDAHIFEAKMFYYFIYGALFFLMVFETLERLF